MSIDRSIITHQQKKINFFCDSISGLESNMVSEISQRKKNTIWFHHMWNLKSKQMSKEHENKLIETENILIIYLYFFKWYIVYYRRIGNESIDEQYDQ